MNHQLYIFVTSLNPDPYINVIRHCLPRYSNFNKEVFFVNIFEDINKEKNTLKSTELIIEGIDKQIDFLSRGQYFYVDKGKTTIKDKIEIDNFAKDSYAELKFLKFTPKVILYDNLESELARIISSNSNVLFDVTALHKDFLIDIYTTLHIMNNNNIFYFKIKKQHRTFDDNDLIHNLKVRTDYDYENISESRITLGTVIIKKDEKQNSIDDIIDSFSSYEANIIKNLLSSFTLLSLLVFIYFFIKDINKWDKIEPWTWLISMPVLFAINIIVNIFSGKKISEIFSFQNIYNIVKSNSLKKLEKKFKNK